MTLWNRSLRCFIRGVLLMQLAAPVAYADTFEVTMFDTDFIQLNVENGKLIATDEGGNRQMLALEGGELRRSTYKPPHAQSRPEDILPDGVVVAGYGKIHRAWLGGATSRYDHAVLGDHVEASRLYVEDEAGRRHVLELDAGYVFEDRFPRLVELDREPGPEVLVIRSNVAKGAAIAVYQLRRGVLSEVAASEPVGRRHRWLNIVGVADFDADGNQEVAIVVTPHIGGTLTLLRPTDGELRPVFRRNGFSNHEYGSRELGMSAVLDLNGDGTADMAVPDAGRRSLVLISLPRGRYREIGRIAHSAGIKSSLHVVDPAGGTGPGIAYLLADRTLVWVAVDRP